MKKVMILGASAGQMPMIRKVKELGYELAVVDYNDRAVGIPYADKFYHASTIDTDAVVRAAKDYKPDGITTVQTDMPMRAVAEACRELHIPGISPEAALNATDKEKMMEAFKRAGVSSPWFYAFAPDDTDAFILGKIQYPCVVKPADNSGSRGVSLAENGQDALGAIAYARSHSRNGRIIVEEYMTGPEVSVEVMMLSGEANVLAVTDKLTTGAPHFIEMGHSEQSRLGAEITEKIKRLAKQAMLAVGAAEGPGHVEIIVTSKGAKVVELGARLGGDFITTDLVPLATGVDFLKAVIQVACGERPDMTPKFHRGSAIRFIPAGEGIIRGIEGMDEAAKIPGIMKVECLRTIGDRIPPLTSSLDRAGYVIAQADNPEQAETLCDQAVKKIKFIVGEEL
ncbi:ATP-grasp domain-containing protein [Ruminococcus sp. OA3]|uniref:ATP-grasp domain-containing protein n=1 Tax=Ruminococcus sp. OA3 TaxID=2914164 RepID=UPI001F070E20|nr:ATP-grasp domain-containing protein [Ruminococcus sp. OA3]MCH1982944.1 ATP-grasp domain-containing protein [Ruminococcus sp. OA3]